MRTWKAAVGAAAMLALSTGGAVQAAPVASDTGGTRANMQKALRSEASAYAEYTTFAEAARRSGHPEIAALFRRIARVELRDHFAKQAKRLRLVRGDLANVRDAIKGETRDLVDYGRWAREAAADGCREAARAFTQIRKDEAGHLARYKKAEKALMSSAPDSAIPSPGRPDHAVVRPGRAKCVARTVRNLRTAMDGEAFAHARYTFYADHARSSGRPRLAALFRGAAETELSDHFITQANLSGLVGDTAANLRAAIAGETEAIGMYGSYAKAAAKAGDRSSAALFREIRGDEEKHHKEFRAALEKLK